MKRAAFYDVDGTLLATTVLHPAAWYARHQALPTNSLRRMAALLLRVPWYWTLDQISRRAFSHRYAREYRGMTRHRLLGLADAMFAQVLSPRIFPGVPAALERARRDGIELVLVSGGLDFTIAPLARHLGIEHVIANQLEFVAGVATGRLCGPSIVAEMKAERMHEFARAEQIDLAQSFAYSDSHSDLPMLEAVGHPAVVRPTRRLERVARRRQWPIVKWR